MVRIIDFFSFALVLHFHYICAALFFPAPFSQYSEPLDNTKSHRLQNFVPSCFLIKQVKFLLKKRLDFKIRLWVIRNFVLSVFLCEVGSTVQCFILTFVCFLILTFVCFRLFQSYYVAYIVLSSLLQLERKMSTCISIFSLHILLTSVVFCFSISQKNRQKTPGGNSRIMIE